MAAESGLSEDEKKLMKLVNDMTNPDTPDMSLFLPRTDKEIKKTVLALSVLPCALGHIEFDAAEDDINLVIGAFHKYLEKRVKSPATLLSLFGKALTKPVPRKCVVPLVDTVCNAFGLALGATTAAASAVALTAHINMIYELILASTAPITSILTEFMEVVNNPNHISSNGPIKTLLEAAIGGMKSFNAKAFALVFYGVVCMLRTDQGARARILPQQGGDWLANVPRPMQVLKWLLTAPEFIVMGCCGDNPLRNFPDQANRFADTVCFTLLDKLAVIIDARHGSTVAEFFQQEYLLSNFEGAFDANRQMDPIVFKTLLATLRSVEHACLMDELKLVVPSGITAEESYAQYQECKRMLEAVFPDLERRFITEAHIATLAGIGPTERRQLRFGDDSQGSVTSNAAQPGSQPDEAHVRRVLEIGPADRELVIRLWLSTVECLLSSLKLASTTLNRTLLEITALFFRHEWSGDAQHEAPAKRYTPAEQDEINKGQHPVIVLKTILRSLGSEASMERLIAAGLFGPIAGKTPAEIEQIKCLFSDSIFRVWTLLSKCYQPDFDDAGHLVYRIPDGTVLDPKVEEFKRQLDVQMHNAAVQLNRVNTTYTLMGLVGAICGSVSSLFTSSSPGGAAAQASDAAVEISEDNVNAAIDNIIRTDPELISRLSSPPQPPPHGAILKLVTEVVPLSQAEQKSSLPEMLSSANVSSALSVLCVLPDNCVATDPPHTEQGEGASAEMKVDDDKMPELVAIQAIVDVLGVPADVVEDMQVARAAEEEAARQEAARQEAARLEEKRLEEKRALNLGKRPVDHGGKSRTHRRRAATTKRSRRKAYNKKSNKRKSRKQLSRKKISRRRQSRRK